MASESKRTLNIRTPGKDIKETQTMMTILKSNTLHTSQRNAHKKKENFVVRTQDKLSLLLGVT